MHVNPTFFRLTDRVLVSVAQFCDHGFSVIFNQSKVFVLSSTEIKLTGEGAQPNGMWFVNLKLLTSLHPPTSNIAIPPPPSKNTLVMHITSLTLKILFYFIIVVASHQSSLHGNKLYEKVFSSLGLD